MKFINWFKKKPRFEHPCHICQRAGRVVPHRGQHAVVYAPNPKPSPGPPLPQGSS